MKKDDRRKPARNTNFIPGIYNYCDRWCERCAFTTRCRTFSMEQEANRREGGPPRDIAAFWKRFEASLKQTKKMVLDLAKERGITFDPAEMEEIGREEERRSIAAEKHPIGRAGMNYIKMVDRWFKTGESALREKEEEILAQAKLGVTRVKEEVASLTDVVEILRWYQHQICVKLMRGLDTDKEEEAKSEFPKDSDGSVKVALIAMDRSIAAWLRLKEFFPDKTDSILMMLVHLDRLRRAAEKAFPDARKFVRPGFDTEDSPK